MVMFSDPVIITGDLTITGRTILSGNTDLPDSIIGNAQVSTGADLSAAKLQHRHSKSVIQSLAIEVVSNTYFLHLVRGAGLIRNIRVRPNTAPTGGDKNYTVDVQKAANGSGTFTSLMTAVITVNSSSVDQTLQNGTLIGSPVVAAGDVIRAVVATGGTTGSQGLGFIIDVQVDESGV